jgi:hypothetical protein
MKARLALPPATLLLTAALVLLDAQAAPQAVATPSAVVHSFYRGYVARFRSDHDPLLDLVLEGSPMVSKSLMTDLRARLNGDADPDDDYFLHSPHGVRPCHGVEVEMLRTTASGASALVTLGALHTPSWRLVVSLSKDAGRWRIGRVTRDHAPPTRKAAVRAMSDC